MFEFPVAFLFMPKEKSKKLGDFPVGTRLFYRSKENWRGAVISKFDEEKVTLIVFSPTGRNYRLKKELKSKVVFDGNFLVLQVRSNDSWRDNFANYDTRW